MKKKLDWDSTLHKLTEAKLKKTSGISGQNVSKLIQKEMQTFKTNNYIMKGHIESILDIDISQDGKVILSVSMDRTVKIWNFNEEEDIYNNIQTVHLDYENMKEQIHTQTDLAGPTVNSAMLRLLTKNECHANSITFSSDNEQFFVGLSNGFISVYFKNQTNTKFSRKINFKAHDSSSIKGVEISLNNEFLLSCSMGSKDHLKLWYLDTEATRSKWGTYKLIQNINSSSKGIKTAKISEDLGIIYAGGVDKKLHIWNNTSKQSIKERIQSSFVMKQTINCEIGEINCIEITDDKKLLVVGGSQNYIKVYKIMGYGTNQSQYHEHQALRGHRGQVNSVQISSDKSLIISCGDEHIVKLWILSKSTGFYHLQQSLEETSKLTDSNTKLRITALKLTHDKSNVIVGSNNPDLRVWPLSQDLTQKIARQSLNFDSCNVYGFCISRDNKFLAVSLGNGRLKIFKLKEDSGTYRIYQSMLLGNYPLFACQFNQNTSLIMIGNSSAEIQILKKDEIVNKYELISSLVLSHRIAISKLKIFNNSKSVAFCLEDGSIGVLKVDIENKTIIELQLIKHSFRTPLIAFDLSTGSFPTIIASYTLMNPFKKGVNDREKKIQKINSEKFLKGEVKIFNNKKGDPESNFQIQQILPFRKSEVTQAVISSQGENIFVGLKSGQVEQYGQAEGERKYYKTRKFKAHFTQLSFLHVMDDDGDTLLTGGVDRSLKMWHRNEGDKIYYLKDKFFKHQYGLDRLVSTLDQNYIVSKGIKSEELEIWSTDSSSNSYKLEDQIASYEGGYDQLQLTEDDKALVVDEKDGCTTIYRQSEWTGSFEQAQKIEFEKRDQTCFSLSSDKQVLVFGTKNGFVFTYRFNKQAAEYLQQQTIEAHYAGVTGFDFTGDHSVLYTCSEDQTLKVWKMNARTQEYDFFQHLKGHSKSIQNCKASFDGEWLVSCSPEMEIVLWRRSERKGTYSKNQVLISEGYEFSAFDICSDNKILVHGDEKGSINVYELDDQIEEYHQLQEMKAHESRVTCIDVSVDHGTFVSGSKDHCIYVWRFNQLTHEYLEAQRFYGHESVITGVAISRDLTSIFSCSEDGSLKLWKREKDVLKVDSVRSGLNKIMQRNGSSGFKFNKHSLKQFLYNTDKNVSREAAHSQLRILYIAVLSQIEEVVELAFELFGYQRYSYDGSGLDPITLALKIDNYVILNVISKYFTENPDSYYAIREDHLFRSIDCSSPSFRAMIISRYLVKGTSRVVLQPQLPGKQDRYPVAVSTPNFKKDQEFSKTLDIVLAKESSKVKTKVRYLTTSLKSEISITSPFMFNLLKKLDNASDDVITSDLKGIVKYLWSKNRLYLLFYCFIYWIFSLLTTINVVWCRTKEDCGVYLSSFKIDPAYGELFKNISLFIIIILYILLVSYELIVICSRRTAYFSSIYNLADIFVYIIYIPVIIATATNDPIMDSLDDKKSFFNFMITLYISLVGARCLANLRVFDGARYIIAMLFQTISDLSYFLFLFVLLILIFSMIETQMLKVQINRGEDEVEPTISSFLKNINLMYQIGYANYTSPAPKAFCRYFWFFVESILMTLVMFNLLIAILSKTFEDSEESKDIQDYKELIEMLLDFGSFAKVTNMIGEQKKYHLHIAMPLNEYNLGKSIFNLSRFDRSECLFG